MDSIADYIVPIIIIISFIASALKKKPEEEKKKPQPQRPGKVERPRKPSLEDLFEREAGPVILHEPPRQKSEVEEYFERALQKSAELEKQSKKGLLLNEQQREKEKHHLKKIEEKKRLLKKRRFKEKLAIINCKE